MTNTKISRQEYKIVKPTPPLNIVHVDGGGYYRCKSCHSDIKKKFIIFGKVLGCINEKCDNWFGHYENRFKQKINITYEK